MPNEQPPLPEPPNQPPAPEAGRPMSRLQAVRELGRKALRRMFPPEVARLSIDQHMEAARWLDDFPEAGASQPPTTQEVQEAADPGRPRSEEMKEILKLEDYTTLGWSKKHGGWFRRELTLSPAQKKARKAGDHQTRDAFDTAMKYRTGGKLGTAFGVITKVVDRLKTLEGKEDAVAMFVNNQEERMTWLDTAYRAARETQRDPELTPEQREDQKSQEDEVEAQLLDPRTVHALVGKILSLAANPTQGEPRDYYRVSPTGLSDARKVMQAGGLMLLNKELVARYLGIQPDAWKRHCAGQEYAMNPAVLEKLNVMVRLTATTWDESQGLHHAGSTLDAMLPMNNARAIESAKNAGDKASFDLAMTEALRPGTEFVEARLARFSRGLIDGRFRVEPLNGFAGRVLATLDELGIAQLIDAYRTEIAATPADEESTARSAGLIQSLELLQAEQARRREENQPEDEGSPGQGKVIHIGGRSGAGPDTTVTGSIPVGRQQRQSRQPRPQRQQRPQRQRPAA